MFLRRITAVAIAAAATTAFAVAPSPATAAPMFDACAWADIQPKTSTDLFFAENAVICLTNKERTAASVPTLAFNKYLGSAARNHSKDMVARKFFGHVNPSGQDIDVRFPAAGYTLTGNWAIAENITCGALKTARQAVTSWMNSPKHKANMLSSKYKEMGVGAVIGSSGPNGCNTANAVNYTQAFGKHG